MNREDFFQLHDTCANNSWGDNQKECYGWWSQQHGEELWALLDRLQKEQVNCILEIGSSHGGALKFFHSIVGQNGLVIGIECSRDIAFSIQKSESKIADNLKLVEGDSHAGLTKARVKKILGDRQIDFLFIDGDHSYEGCKKDYEMYSPLVRPGGLVGFHDVAIEPRVQKVFEEISLPKQILPVHFMGIGLVRI
jgi:cephalosporin hydroxylase